MSLWVDMQYQNLRRFSSKPPVLGREQKHRFPKRPFRQPGFVPCGAFGGFVVEFLAAIRPENCMQMDDGMAWVTDHIYNDKHLLQLLSHLHRDVILAACL